MNPAIPHMIFCLKAKSPLFSGNLVSPSVDVNGSIGKSAYHRRSPPVSTKIAHSRNGTRVLGCGYCPIARFLGVHGHISIGALPKHGLQAADEYHPAQHSK